MTEEAVGPFETSVILQCPEESKSTVYESTQREETAENTETLVFFDRVLCPEGSTVGRVETGPEEVPPKS
jgi:hypothetical protein